MNFPTEIKWITSGDYAVSETVDFGEREIHGLHVRMSGYACRTGNDLRFFGNYRIRQGDRILSDQRGLDVDSFTQLLAFATRMAKQLSRDLEVDPSAGLQQNNCGDGVEHLFCAEKSHGNEDIE
jgi:hypothetical protein